MWSLVKVVWWCMLVHQYEYQDLAVVDPVKEGF